MLTEGWETSAAPRIWKWGGGGNALACGGGVNALEGVGVNTGKTLKI